MSSKSKLWQWAVYLFTNMVVITACVSTTPSEKLPPLQTVAKVDLDRYLGTWYEIATIPMRFQKGCFATQAEYERRDDGQISVTNSCRDGSLEAPYRFARGRARVIDRQSNAKLEVTFFWPFWGDYWVIELADDYSYAVVGHPSRKYLWILGRSPRMQQEIYDVLLGRLRNVHGYLVEQLVRTVHP